MQSKTLYDAVVIGSGHNGLVAAAFLAQAGKSVLVLEARDQLGGATASEKIFPDYDAWLSSYSYLISLFPDQIIKELGLNFSTRQRRTASFTPWSDHQGIARGLLLSNVDPHRSRDSVYELPDGRRDWQGLQRLQELQTTLADIVWPSLLQPLRSREDFVAALQTADQREAWAAFVERPVGEVIERLLSSDVLRGVVLTDAKIGLLTHAHDASLAQNRCFLYHVIGGGTGEWRVPVGGMRSLVSELQRCCRKHSAELLTSAPALQVTPNGNRHVVQFRSGESLQQVTAKHVLINAAPHVYRQLLNQTHKVPAVNAAQPADEGSVIKINMLLKRLPRLRTAGTSSADAFSGSLHLDEGYQQLQTSYQQAVQGIIPAPAPADLYCHTLTDSSILSPELAASGFQTLTLFGLDMPWRLFEHQPEVRRQQVLQHYLDGLDRICAEPFSECIARDRDGQLCLQLHTPQDLETELHLTRGNIFHNALSWFFAEDPEHVGKWGVETDFPGVYLAGSSAMRGGAVSGIPGRNAAMCVLQQDER